MKPRYRSRKTSGIRADREQITAATAARRARALKASIAATAARKRTEHHVDWDAAIARFKTMMTDRYEDEENT